MKSFKCLFMILLIVSLSSCAMTTGGSTTTSGQVKPDRDTRGTDEDQYKFSPPEANKLKGTNSEIMNAFKGLLSRYELETFDMGMMKIVTKIKKMDDTDPNYLKYKKSTDIFEKYEITMKRVEYTVLVDIKYLVLTNELDMQSGKVEMVTVARDAEMENKLMERVKRFLYQY